MDQRAGRRCVAVGRRRARRHAAGRRRARERRRTLRAGIEIRLAPGWKTYWRYPGDSGVPPRFDFARFAECEIGHDATGRRRTASATTSGITIGYKDDVIFPLHVVPQDPSKPVRLRLKLDYAICEKICVPAEGSAELALDGRPLRARRSALAAFEAQVPKRAQLGDGAPLAVRAVRRDDSGDVRASSSMSRRRRSGPIDLFAEGPTPDWALPVPEPIAGAPAGLQRFAFVARRRCRRARRADGAVLTFTLVAGGSAVDRGRR